MDADQLSRELRNGEDGYLRYRRGIVGCSFLAAKCMEVIGLYQMGLIRHLPEPPVEGLDADRVDAAPEAYEKLSMPDAFLGFGSYAVTAALASMGGADRPERRPWIPLALGVKTVLDATQAAKLTRQQAVKHRAYCSWCLLAAGATFASVVLALPEAWAASRRLFRSHR